ncbi:TPA: RepB family plasmid replication initiator protein [Vibrio vulnificus]|uniref:RepB family plasmid replication initiator protein n=1 Tax=Vibrio vulnificus TaxID=672 RepID=A0A8H9TGC0_VIBVL|nr:replication initiation protein [Vibrio vulnificus]HAS8541030.1 RepB family plasmid replication initiator protein [Vibrio vulnificus]
MNQYDLSNGSRVVMRSEFPERSFFANIHSFRMCLSWMALADLEYPDLATATREDITKYFKKIDLDEPDTLKLLIPIDSYVSVWKGANPSKTKQQIRQALQKEILKATYHNESDDELIAVFNRVKPEGEDMIAAYVNPVAMPFLINPHLSPSGFIGSTCIGAFVPFRSIATAKLLQEMIRYKDTSVLYLSPGRLKSITQAKTDLFKTLNRDVIKKASDELKKLGYIDTDLEVSVVKKIRNKVESFKIHFSLTDKAFGK